MDNVSVEQYKKGRRNLFGLVLTIIFTSAIVAGLFTNYKQETLLCIKSKNICYIERTNLVNQKSKKKLAKFSDIGSVSYFREKVRGNRYAKGYTSYLLTFVLQNNNPIVIFSSSYLEKDEIDNAMKTLTLKLKDKKDIIRYNRD